MELQSAENVLQRGYKEHSRIIHSPGFAFERNLAKILEVSKS